MIELKRRNNGEVIHSGEYENTRELVEYCAENDISMAYADLHGVDLHEANLYGAKGVRAFTVGNSNRFCFTYIYKDIQRYQLGCFNGTLEETCEAIQKKYGEGSSYERIVRVYGELDD